ncbi:hypothetical protein [Acidilobus sp.]|uniref:hypothetical protein n=1 Tax=Acidilobus sp. TaxID=1872109 RepID=UPI003D06733E
MVLAITVVLHVALNERTSTKLTALTLITPTLIVIGIRFLVTDLADRYYITDFEDSFNHMYRSMYIAEYGYLTPYPDFMWLNRSFWFILAEAILVLWGYLT